MQKTYRTGFGYSITVKTASGARVNVRFLNDSFGGSYYETSNKEIQDALEATGLLGKDFYLDGERDITPKAEDAKADENELTDVEVNDIEEAKQYLVDNFSASRRSMRSVASIKAIAEKNGINFLGI